MIHVAAYNLLVFSCRDSRLVFVDVAAKYKVIQSTHLLDYVRCFAHFMRRSLGSVLIAIASCLQ